jgi:hypothetical protein
MRIRVTGVSSASFLYEHKLPPGVISPVSWDKLSLLDKQNGNNEPYVSIRQYTSAYVSINECEVFAQLRISYILTIQISKINSSI